MRLLNVHTQNIEHFHDESRPSYAILSHTWGYEEVTFQDMSTAKGSKMAGYTKIQQCCRQAIEAQLQYVWVDTCCIDKSSSAELSEAINSQFRWYQLATVCYVYLEDVLYKGKVDESFADLQMARWFTRGWTLQELIAPTHVVFFDAEWRQIGTKAGLSDDLQRITKVPASCLRNGSPVALARYSVAEKMSWAAARNTTRLEDIAYCLLGLFDVYMPLLYGEGRRAFWRLQSEILKQTTDQSLFAWRSHGVGIGDLSSPTLIFADSPAQFHLDGETVLGYKDPIILADEHGSIFKHQMSQSNIGLTAWMPLIGSLSERLVFAAMNCKVQHSGESRSKLWLVLWRTDRESYHRLDLFSGVVDPSAIGSQLTLGAAEMICIENKSSKFVSESYGTLRYQIRPYKKGKSSTHGILIALPAGKQSFTRVASFPADDANELGIFWLCEGDVYDHGIIIFENSSKTPTKRIGVFFAIASGGLNPDLSHWTCRVVASVDDASLKSPKEISELELEKLRSESGSFREPMNIQTPLWRTRDQLDKTVVHLDRAAAWYATPDGILKLASLVFDHPLEHDQFSSISGMFRDLAVG